MSETVIFVAAVVLARVELREEVALKPEVEETVELPDCLADEELDRELEEDRIEVEELVGSGFHSGVGCGVQLVDGSGVHSSVHGFSSGVHSGLVSGFGSGLGSGFG